jgi:hypothetical protein
MDLEHVQPVQSLTPHGRSRTRTRVAATLPVVLLAAVVGLAILGQDGGDDAERAARATGEPPARGTAAPPSRPAPVPDEPVAGRFPALALDLPVGAVAETIRLRASGEIGDEPIAIGGWLTVPPSAGCDEHGHGSDLVCPRDTILLDEPLQLLTIAGGDIRLLRAPREELHPQAMPGIPLDPVTTAQTAGGRRVLMPVPVVIVGRYGDPRLRQCPSSSGGCADSFAIERIIWIEGQWWLRRPVRHPAVADHQLSGKVRWPIVNEAMDRSGVILSELVAPREDLARIDPAADRAVADDVTGAVWYVRALLRPRTFGEAPEAIGWAVIEDATGRVLAAEPAPRTARVSE